MGGCVRRERMSSPATRPKLSVITTCSSGICEIAERMRSSASETEIIACCRQAASKVPDFPPDLWVRRISVICIPRSIALHMS